MTTMFLILDYHKFCLCTIFLRIGLKPVKLLKNPVGLHQFMTKNLSFDQRLTSEFIFNTSVDRKSLFQVLFHNPNVSAIYNISNEKLPPPSSEDYSGEGFLYSYLRMHDISAEVFPALMGARSGDMTPVIDKLSNLLKVSELS